MLTPMVSDRWGRPYFKIDRQLERGVQYYMDRWFNVLHTVVYTVMYVRSSAV
jgi:hypothetical protein